MITSGHGQSHSAGPILIVCSVFAGILASALLSRPQQFPGGADRYLNQGKVDNSEREREVGVGENVEIDVKAVGETAGCDTTAATFGSRELRTVGDR